MGNVISMVIDNKCITCNGVGKYPSYRRCYVCYGTGYYYSIIGSIGNVLDKLHVINRRVII